MSFKKTILMAAAILCGFTLSPDLGASPRSGKTSNVSFAEPVITTPVIPEYTVSLPDFGGTGDGVALNTQPFEEAIAALSRNGGGRLVVPAGVWFTGPIVLRSNTELWLDEDAILVFSADKDLYPIVPSIFEGRETYRCLAPISAVGATNVAIRGRGIIDGNGDPWRAVKKDKVAPSQWKAIVSGGGILSDDKRTWYPSESFKLGAGNADQNLNNWATTPEDFASIRDFLRPVMIYMKECSNIALEGVTFQNSPCWNIHLVMSSNITVDGITVRCPWYAQNGDGIDIESCDRVVVRNSSFDVGDDAICIKSGKDEDGRRRGIPSRDILVENCTVFHGHGGFVVGSEMSGGVENVTVRNCRFSGTDVGLRFKSTRGRGGVVRNIRISDIVMNDIATEALLFDLFYGGKSALEELEEGNDGAPRTDMSPLPADVTTPEFRDIYISNVICRGARRAMLFNGLPEMNVSNVMIENSRIHARIGAQINESTDVTLRNVSITPEEGPALMINNVKKLSVDGFSVPDGATTVMTVTGSRNRDIEIASKSITADNSEIASTARKAVKIVKSKK